MSGLWLLLRCWHRSWYWFCGHALAWLSGMFQWFSVGEVCCFPCDFPVVCGFAACCACLGTLGPVGWTDHSFGLHLLSLPCPCLWHSVRACGLGVRAESLVSTVCPCLCKVAWPVLVVGLGLPGVTCLLPLWPPWLWHHVVLVAMTGVCSLACHDSGLGTLVLFKSPP